MSDVFDLTATDGTPIQVMDQVAGSGTMKDVYYSPDRSYVVAFYREPVTGPTRERLETIVSTYRNRIFQGVEGDYWKSVFCWPERLVEAGGRLGLVVPTYPSNFFFAVGSRNGDMLGLKGREKEGKWFASAKHRKKYLDPSELGDFRQYLGVLVKISRAVRRLHMAGLAHSDLSYKNVLVDPITARACIIDIDGLVVPAKYPPEVVGTPDFIAPEVVATSHLPPKDPSRVLPSISTDRHALAVLVYMYLVYRHPLKGRQVHDVGDDLRDENLRMGERALFVEHPTDRSNRPGANELHEDFLPWADPDKIPFSIGGPHISGLIEQAFVEGLHQPSRRPTADQWETALVTSADLLFPCRNETCEQKWFVFDEASGSTCPFCQTTHAEPFPVLEFFSSRGGQPHRPDNHRLVVFHNLYLYPWHVNRLVVPGERLEAHQKRPVGYFAFHKRSWILVNQALPEMQDLETSTSIPIRSSIALTEGKRILLSGEDGGRLVEVRMVGG